MGRGVTVASILALIRAEAPQVARHFEAVYQVCNIPLGEVRSPEAAELSELQRVAASVLLCESPYQLRTGSSVLYVLRDLALTRPFGVCALSGAASHSLSCEAHGCPPPCGLSLYCSEGARSRSSLELIALGRNRTTFPLKEGGVAAGKANVFSSDALRDTYQRGGPSTEGVSSIWSLLDGLFNDQVANILVYGHAASHEWDSAWSTALAAVRRPGDAKALSNVLKATGLTASLKGAMLAEMENLQGKGVGETDLLADAESRVTEKCFVEAARIDLDDLKTAIDAVVSQGLSGATPHFETLERYWQRRFIGTPNGGHSRAGDSFHGRPRIELPAGVDGRIGRRVAAVFWADEPISDWDGRVSVTIAPKYEAGKVRPIYPCDTISYYAFDHLLRPVEDVWVQDSVILDPDRGGHATMVERVSRLRDHGTISAMFDYTAFNNQHTLAAQQAVISAVVVKAGYPPALGKKLVDSFEKMFIISPHWTTGRRVLSTLMSGHRCTSFINSILNAAYIRVVVGADLYSLSRFIHVGDDVYASCPGPAEVGALVGALMQEPQIVHMNPLKQSVGPVVAEFLRMVIQKCSAHEYLARAVASAVMADWFTDHTLTPGRPRSTSRGRGMTMRPALLLCSGRASVTNTYAQIVSGKAQQIVVEGDVDKPAESRAYREALRSLPKHASSDYVAHCLSPVETRALELTGVKDIVSRLSRTVYSTLLDQLAEVPRAGPLAVERYRASAKWTLVSRAVGPGCETLEAALKRDKPGGILSRYVVLPHLRASLTPQNRRELLGVLGVVPPSKDSVLLQLCWGTEAVAVGIIGNASASDRGAAAARTTCGTLRATLDVRM